MNNMDTWNRVKRLAEEHRCVDMDNGVAKAKGGGRGGVEVGKGAGKGDIGNTVNINNV